jgi:exonuclease SbcD
LDIKTDRVLTQAEIKEMKELRKDIVQIRPIFMGKDDADGEKVEDYMKLKTDQLFKAFYQSRRGTEAPDEIMKLFYEIAEEEGGEDAASPIED